MKTAYILVGIPASGKSTWINSQAWVKECVYVSTDMHVEKHAASLGKTYSEVFEDYMPEAVSNMLDDVEFAIHRDMNIVWDQTSTTVLNRAKKIKMLEGYHKIAVVFKVPDPFELERRLNSRPGKIIPQDVVDRMIAGFEVPTKSEGFDEVWFAA